MEILQAIGLFAMVFTASLAVSYLVSSWKGRKVEEVKILENTKVRMVGAGGAYRCFYLRAERRGLIFSNPLQKDRYVPLRVGDAMIVQVPGEEGLMTFCSEILVRSIDTHELTLAHPKLVRRMDRRSEERDTTCRGSLTEVNGIAGEMVDLSAGGMKAVLAGHVTPGEPVTVKLPAGMGIVDGWALEAVPAAWEGRLAREVRVQFQRPFLGLSARPRP
jgi:hypothetical protein